LINNDFSDNNVNNVEFDINLVDINSLHNSHHIDDVNIRISLNQQIIDDKEVIYRNNLSSQEFVSNEIDVL
jgi:hypothetical protein